MKTLNEIKKTLSESKNELRRKYKVKEIGVFGSYVRGEQKKKSDGRFVLFPNSESPI